MLDNDGLNALIFQKRQKFTTLLVQAGADFLDETINLNSVQRRPFRDARDLAVESASGQIPWQRRKAREGYFL